MNIAIISSASNDAVTENKKIISQLLSEIKKNFQEPVIMTGGSLGIPGEVVKQATELHTPTVCYSPDLNAENHEKRHDNLSTHYFSTVHYIPGFTARSLQMIHDADGVILLNGRIGTLSEFTIALEEGKKVAVITETGGIADHLEYILDIAQKEFPGQVFFSDDINEIINFLKQ